IMAILSIWYVGQRAKEEGENAKMLSLLRRQHRLFALYNLGVSAIYLLLAVVIQMESLEASNGVQTGRGVLALALVLLVAGCVARSEERRVGKGCTVVSYARTWHMRGAGNRMQAITEHTGHHLLGKECHIDCFTLN